MAKLVDKVKYFFKTRMGISFTFLIISAIIFHFIVFPYSDPFWWYITFSFVTMFLTMALFESVLSGLKKKKLKIFGGKKKPKIFEFGFFLTIFIATISSAQIVTMVFQSELSVDDKLELIRQQFWFTGLYGIAIAFGIYHYILRIDDEKQ